MFITMLENRCNKTGEPCTSLSALFLNVACRPEEQWCLNSVQHPSMKTLIHYPLIWGTPYINLNTKDEVYLLSPSHEALQLSSLCSF